MIPFTLLRDLGTVAGLANGGLLVVFLLAIAALVNLRYETPDATPGFTAPPTIGRVSGTALAGLCSPLGLFLFHVTNVL